jgi:PPK2 family polyphosphate:nucleotide phosphotransferase
MGKKKKEKKGKEPKQEKKATSPATKEPVSVRDLLRVGPDFNLSQIDPRRIVAGPEDKDMARAEAAALEAEVTALQEQLYAESKGGGKRRLLVVLQGMDTSGKGGAAKAIDRISEPIGLRMANFGSPTKEELRHHYLWRIEKALPPVGSIGIFDRSHYEDVLIVRVRNLVPEDVWSTRYDEINAWEKKLSAGGLVFLKCMLHISKAEQQERLLARLMEPDKNWKYNPGDVDERLLWDQYQEAYQVALTQCSTDYAPWYVIPADRKWHRDWLLTHLVAETLREMNPQYPAIDYDVETEIGRVQAS